MTVKDIHKLFYHDNIYTLELMEISGGEDGGECNSLYQDNLFTDKDWEREVKNLDVRDVTVDIDNPSIIVYCYVEENT